jgi:hypothetical protein
MHARGWCAWVAPCIGSKRSHRSGGGTRDQDVARGLYRPQPSQFRVLGVNMRSIGSFSRLGRHTAGGVLFAAALLANGLVHAKEGQWLYIEFDPDRVRYAVDAVNDPDVQPIARASQADCTLTTSGPEYLVFGGSPALAGFKNGTNLIGLTGTSCGRVRNAQSLSIALGSELPGQKMLLARLSFAFVNNVRVFLETLDEEGLVETFEIRTGNYRSVAPTVDPAHVINCAASPCVLPLLGGAGLRWDTIRMTTSLIPGQPGTAGEWSIGAGPSRIKLMDFVPDGDLACGDDTESTDGTGLRRLFDVGVTDPEDCGPQIPYALTFGGETLEFIADYGVLDPGVEPAFEWQATWDPEAVPLTVGDEVIFNPGEGPTLGERVPLSDQYFQAIDPVFTVDMCAGEAQYEPDGLGGQTLTGLVLVPDADHPEDPYGRYDMSPPPDGLPGIQYGCYLERSILVLLPEACEITGEDELCVQVTEKGYVRGDWTSTRTLR